MNRTAKRVALVLLAALPVLAVTWALTPPYDAAREMEEEMKQSAAHKLQPAPGSEKALREMIGQLQQGKPDYGRMGSRLAAAVRAQLAHNAPELAALGPPLAITYIRGTPQVDLFRVKFRTDEERWSIGLGSGGRVEVLGYGPMGMPTAQQWIANYARFGWASA